MNKLLLTLLFVTTQTFAFTLVSDFDDTIKITDSGSDVDGGINAFLTDNYFTGIPDLYKAAAPTELHVLSASPMLLRSRIQKSFSKRGLKVTSLILKNSTSGDSQLVYKVRELKKLFKQSNDTFVLVGDDVGQDPEAYAEIKRLYPERVLAIYIHVIKNRPFEGTPYWTSFDLALREYLARRLPDSAVLKSAELLLSESKFKFIVPGFANCPSDELVWSWQSSTLYSAEALSLSKKIVKECKARSSGI